MRLKDREVQVAGIREHRRGSHGDHAAGAERDKRSTPHLDPMALSGVRWATASVLLHFGHQDRYPILDYRALVSFGVTGNVNFTIPFWNAYVAVCRTIDDQTKLGMRALDRALWQWSKEHA